MTETDPPPDVPTWSERLRTMNESIRLRRDEFAGGLADRHSIMCECPDSSCAAMIEISGEDLRAARFDQTLFVIQPDHAGEADEVVVRAPGHLVVRMARA